MNLTELFTAQLDWEAERCRRALQNVPEGRNDWKPHEKSMQLGHLANLVATMPSWIAMMIDQDELDLNPPGGSGYAPQEWTTTGDLIQALDDSVEKARAALANTNDDFLQTSWRLLLAEQVVMEHPRYQVIADTFAHLAHHRGQLTVYLRLNDATVPALYGPSADEPSFG